MAIGLNIYLISRTEAKLQAAAAEIAREYGVETKYFAADLAAAGMEPTDKPCWTDLKSALSNVDIGILVNNAGLSYSYPGYFHEVDQATVHNILALNNAALVKMTYLVLPGMLERKRGAIMNISSGSATLVAALPLLTEYAASKAFVDAFSKSLAEEYRDKGIHIQVGHF